MKYMITGILSYGTATAALVMFLALTQTGCATREEIQAEKITCTNLAKTKKGDFIISTSWHCYGASKYYASAVHVPTEEPGKMWVELRRDSSIWFDPEDPNRYAVKLAKFEKEETTQHVMEAKRWVKRKRNELTEENRKPPVHWSEREIP